MTVRALLVDRPTPTTRSPGLIQFGRTFEVAGCIAFALSVERSQEIRERGGTCERRFR
jgi:hypothetical protein